MASTDPAAPPRSSFAPCPRDRAPAGRAAAAPVHESVRTAATLDEASRSGAAKHVPRPALTLACGPLPIGRVFPIGDAGLVIGRGSECGLVVNDEKVSRQHVRVRVAGDVWMIDDLGSRNGTWVDGRRIAGPWRGIPRTLRVGACVFVPIADVGDQPPVAFVASDGTVAGFALRAAWQRIDAAAHGGLALHLQGESGSGKEVAARRYHTTSARRGAFIAVNCAAIPAELAERILFGARRGAFSGAVADVDGLIQAAHGGTLFLDEIGELPAAVQAKLLRVLECREVTPLGANRATPVEFALVSATHRDLAAEIGGGTFRADLFYRIAGFTVVIPPLRERGEELAVHIARELGALPDAALPSPEFVEACALRRWDGNVRELRAAVRRAATEAALRRETHLRAEDLPAQDGGAARPLGDPLADPEVVEAALRRYDGNISACARGLGVHRNQLRRWIDRLRPARAATAT
jgi:transcriptional regulator of aromatic amino acid metabolism